jgi:type II secretory pathway component PulK
MNAYSTNSRSGMALVLALVLTGLLTALALHIHSISLLHRRIDQQVLDQARLRAALTDEAFALLRALANDSTPQLFALDHDLLRRTEKERPDGITTLSRIVDLNRFVDLNDLVPDESFSGYPHSERIIEELMLQCGDFAAVPRITALKDWIRPQANSARGPEFYLRRDPPYETANTWLHTWNELLLIEGFAPDYFEPKPMHAVGRPFSANFIEHITLIPGPRARPMKININTATPEVLHAVMGPAHEPITRFILTARQDRPFRSIEALIAQADRAWFTELAPFVDVNSTHFVVEVSAFAGARRANLRAIAQRLPNGTLAIKTWTLQGV